MTTRRATWLTLGLTALLSCSASAADPIKGPGWISDKSLIYVEVAEPGRLVDQIKADHVQKYLYSIPAYNKALEAPQFRQILQAVEVITKQLGTTWDDGLKKLAGGGVAFTVQVAGDKPGIALVVTPSDPKFLNQAVETIVKLGKDDAENNGKPSPFQEVEYRGARGFHAGEATFGIYRETLILGNNPMLLKELVDRVEDGQPGNLAASETYKTRKAAALTEKDQLAWGYMDLAGLRKVDPKGFNVGQKLDGGQVLLLGSWIETLKQAPWVAATLAWNDLKLGANLTLPTPPEGLPAGLKYYVPGKGEGAAKNLTPPGTIASLSLWRDMGMVWENRENTFPDEFNRQMTNLDNVAGQFFGAKEFGTGVLSNLTPNWRLVVAHQDYEKLDPSPDLKLPGFAIVLGLRDDDEFAQRIRSTFQAFVGFSNINAAQNQAPPLELGSEKIDDVTITTSKYMKPKKAPAQGTPIDQRHNFTPSAVQVGNHFVISSSTSLARDLVKLLKEPVAAPNSETLVLQADGRALSQLVKVNHNRLVMQNMIEKGNDKPASEAEIETLEKLFDYLGTARLTVKESEKTWQMRADFTLNPVK